MKAEQYKAVKRVRTTIMAVRSLYQDIQADERKTVKCSAHNSPIQQKALNNFHHLNRMIPICDTMISITEQLIFENEEVKTNAYNP